ncbi:EF-hand domain-containing protein [Bdellovibrio sp. HCB117]|uniref:EF-hand domain-containing protein n=1 Tax=Bdellovibrio sp. HCB117 TaxID=3394359 RepID=UPI0039B42966
MFLRRWLPLPLLFGIGVYAHAEQEPAAVNSGVGGTAGFQGVVLSGQVTRAAQNSITVNITNTCFGTNLRSVSNPIARGATVEFNVAINDKGTIKNFFVKYPSDVVSNAGNDTVTDITGANVSPGVTASFAGNSVRMVVPISVTTTVDEEGNISEDFDVKLHGTSFTQRFAPKAGQEYMGTDGPLSASVYTSSSKDGRQYSVSAFFPGENGYCGGYFSPLMVFFDDNRPRFDGHSEFPLNPSGKTSWPEKKAPGAFVAIDRDGDKKITKVDELFGNEGEKFKNGFEALREFDSNGDGVIDKNDKDFAKLLLWFDKNGDGKSQASELVPLKSRIKSISLKYDDSAKTPFGSRAEARERSTFVFVEKGKEKQGSIIDMWFSPQ